MAHTSTVWFLLLNTLFNSLQYLVDSDISQTIYGDILHWGINSDHRKSYVKQVNIVLLSNSTMSTELSITFMFSILIGPAL